jgi:hypothetical protein
MKNQKVTSQEEKDILDRLLGKEDANKKQTLFVTVETKISMGKENKVCNL